MITGVKKKDKTTEIWFNEADRLVEIRTYNTDLKNRLSAYATEYPELCRLTDDDECGCLSFEIDKRLFGTADKAVHGTAAAIGKGYDVGIE